MLKKIQKSSSNLKQRKLGFVSYLMKKEANDLYSFSQDEVFLEAAQTMPEIVSILVRIFSAYLVSVRLNLDVQSHLKNFSHNMNLHYISTLYTKIYFTATW